MLAGIAAWLAKVGIGTIANRLAAAYEAREKAKTDKEKIAADERIKTLQARRDVLVAEAGNRVNGWMRAALAMPVAIILWKVFVYDKAIGQWTRGTTDALSPELWQVVMIVIGFYFLAAAALDSVRQVCGAPEAHARAPLEVRCEHERESGSRLQLVQIHSDIDRRSDTNDESAVTYLVDEPLNLLHLCTAIILEAARDAQHQHLPDPLLK
jgi:hypothetical protein